jgi:uncharacterized coiled-coil protein SlyX
MREELSMRGGSGGGTLEPRIAKLESDVGHIQSDIGHIRSDVLDLRAEIRQVRDRIKELADDLHGAKIWAFGLYIAGLGAMLYVMAKGFGWLK